MNLYTSNLVVNFSKPTSLTSATNLKYIRSKENRSQPTIVQREAAFRKPETTGVVQHWRPLGKDKHRRILTNIAPKHRWGLVYMKGWSGVIHLVFLGLVGPRLNDCYPLCRLPNRLSSHTIVLLRWISQSSVGSWSRKVLRAFLLSGFPSTRGSINTSQRHWLRQESCQFNWLKCSACGPYTST